jgi:hypothetical protein
MIMLESRLSLNVTVFIPKLLGDLLYGHTTKDRMIAPDTLASLPGGDKVWTATGLSLGREHDFILIANFDVFHARRPS